MGAGNQKAADCSGFFAESLAYSIVLTYEFTDFRADNLAPAAT